jgi:hypothetical protein
MDLEECRGVSKLEDRLTDEGCSVAPIGRFMVTGRRLHSEDRDPATQKLEVIDRRTGVLFAVTQPAGLSGSFGRKRSFRSKANACLSSPPGRWRLNLVLIRGRRL